MAAANEKLKSLHNDLNMFKKHLKQEMDRLSTDIADTAEMQMEQVTKVHSDTKTKMEVVINQLTEAQGDAKDVSVRITELKNKLQDQYESATTDIKVSDDLISSFCIFCKCTYVFINLVTAFYP